MGGRVYVVACLALIWAGVLWPLVARNVPPPGADHEEWDVASVVLRRPVVDCLALGWLDYWEPAPGC
jgi:hypothetical protein